MFDKHIFRALIEEISRTRGEEIGCDECFEQVHRFIDLELLGLDAARAMPLVRQHLEICGECRDEFSALLLALRSVEDPCGPVHEALTGLLRKLERSPNP